MSRLSSFQLLARIELEALTSLRQVQFHWSEEPGSLYEGEVMLVGRTEDTSITIWVYDDALDYRLWQSDTVNFEAESFPDEQTLLAAALAQLQQRIAPITVVNDVPRA